MPKSKFASNVADSSRENKNRASSHLKLPHGIPLFKEEGGMRVSLDFLPYKVTDPKHPDRKDETERAVVGSLWYRRPYRLHRNIGVNNEGVVCPGSIGKKCPICEVRKRLVSRDAEKEDIDAVKSSLRMIYCVIPKGHKDYEEILHIWDMSSFLFQDMLDDEMGEDPDGRGIFPDPEEGLTLRIRFSEEKMGKNKFGKASRIDFVEREEKYTEKTLNKVPNLDDILLILSYDQIKEKFMEEGEEETTSKHKHHDDDDDDEPIRPKRKMKEEEEDDDEEPVRPKRRVKEEDDDDEKPARPKRKVVEEEEEEEKPRRKKAVQEDEEEEEEEEEKPHKRINKNGTCPSGYVFGKDCEKYQECDDCPVWKQCYAAKGAMKTKPKVDNDED